MKRPTHSTLRAAVTLVANLLSRACPLVGFTLAANRSTTEFLASAGILVALITGSGAVLASGSFLPAVAAAGNADGAPAAAAWAVRRSLQSSLVVGVVAAAVWPGIASILGISGGSQLAIVTGLAIAVSPAMSLATFILTSAQRDYWLATIRVGRASLILAAWYFSSQAESLVTFVALLLVADGLAGSAAYLLTVRRTLGTSKPAHPRTSAVGRQADRSVFQFGLPLAASVALQAATLALLAVVNRLNAEELAVLLIAQRIELVAYFGPVALSSFIFVRLSGAAASGSLEATLRQTRQAYLAYSFACATALIALSPLVITFFPSELGGLWLAVVLVGVAIPARSWNSYYSQKAVAVGAFRVWVGSDFVLAGALALIAAPVGLIWGAKGAIVGTASAYWLSGMYVRHHLGVGQLASAVAPASEAD